MTQEQLTKGKDLSERIQILEARLKSIECARGDGLFNFALCVSRRDIVMNFMTMEQKEAIVALIKSFIKTQKQELEAAFKDL